MLLLLLLKVKVTKIGEVLLYPRLPKESIYIVGGEEEESDLIVLCEKANEKRLSESDEHSF